MSVERKPATYKIVEMASGRRYSFFCDLSGAFVVETSSEEQGRTPEEELKAAWSCAEKHFNVCCKCGKNVIDAMYNADTGQCVKCMPWQRPPVFCSVCGKRFLNGDSFCRSCGKKIVEGGVDENAK